jgi:hypothetical protein
MVCQDRQLPNELGVYKSDADHNLYYKVESGCPLILVLYVDDLFLTSDEKLIVGCKRELTSEFEIVISQFVFMVIGQKIKG